MQIKLTITTLLSASLMIGSTLAPGDVLRATFTSIPNGSDLIQFFSNASLTLTGTPVLTTQLYNGPSLLGTVIGSPISFNGSYYYQTTFETPNSAFNALNPSTQANLTSMLNGTIQGSLQVTVSGGSISGFDVAAAGSPPVVVDPNGIWLYDAQSIGSTGYRPEAHLINQNFTLTSSAISLLTLANLSNNVYFGGSGDFGGYSSFTTNCSAIPSQCSYSGFRSVAYASADQKQIVIAFRGTDFGVDAGTSLNNFFADTSFANNTPSADLRQSVSDAAAFVKAIQQQYPNATITLTGHSLGGAIAQILGKASGLTADAFNAPGAGLLYGKLGSEVAPVVGIGSGGSNVDYRIYGDQVSIAGSPIDGTGYVTLPVPTGYPTYTLGSDSVQNVVHNLNTILDYHSMNAILSDLNADASPVSNAGEANMVATLANMIQAKITNALFSVITQTYYLLDPSSGTDFLFTTQPNSPNFASIDLPPLSGIALYDLRYEIGNTWSTFQSVQPGVNYIFPTGVDGIEFSPVNQLGNGVSLSGFLFDASFASDGTFSGTLTETQPTPEPSCKYLAGFGILALYAIRACKGKARL